MKTILKPLKQDCPGELLGLFAFGAFHLKTNKNLVAQWSEIQKKASFRSRSTVGFVKGFDLKGYVG